MKQVACGCLAKPSSTGRQPVWKKQGGRKEGEIVLQYCSVMYSTTGMVKAAQTARTVQADWDCPVQWDAVYYSVM